MTGWPPHAPQPSNDGVLDQRRVARDRARAWDLSRTISGRSSCAGADVVVGDYNYYFDSSAPLYALTGTNQWKVGILVDEAHNLIERARKMYSASLERATLEAVRFGAPMMLKGVLDRVARAWDTMLEGQSEVYGAYDEVPEGFLGTLERSVAAITRTRRRTAGDARHRSGGILFRGMRFCTLAASLDSDTLFDISQGGAVHAMPAKRHSAALPGAPLVGGACRGTVLGNIEPARIPSRCTGSAGAEPPHRRAVAFQGRATRGAHRALHLDPLARSGRLGAAHSPSHGEASSRHNPATTSPSSAASTTCSRSPHVSHSSNPNMPDLAAGAGMSESERTGFLQRFAPRRPRHRFCGARRGFWRGDRSTRDAPHRRVHRDPGNAAGESGERGNAARAWKRDSALDTPTPICIRACRKSCRLPAA